MAGLVAARILNDTGFEVRVLEARDRLGGRIWTVTDLGRPVDLGASWIHGVRGNPLTKWCKHLGIPIQRFPRGITRFIENGKPKHLPALALSSWRGILNAAIRYMVLSRIDMPKPHISDLFQPLIGNARLPLIDRRFLAWMEALQEGINGAPADALSIGELEIPNLLSANAIPLYGYGALIQDAAKDLDVATNCEVRKINWRIGR